MPVRISGERERGSVEGNLKTQNGSLVIFYKVLRSYKHTEALQ